MQTNSFKLLAHYWIYFLLKLFNQMPNACSKQWINGSNRQDFVRLQIRLIQSNYMDIKQTIDLVLAASHSRNVSQDSSLAARRSSLESTKDASFRVKKNKRSCGTSFNLNYPSADYSATEASSMSNQYSQCRKTVLVAPATSLSNHNGLITPFSRRQISFMRNLKQRPGPLQQISCDSLLGIELGFDSKPIDEQTQFRATFHSAFLPPKTKRMKSRKDKEQPVNREVFVLKSKTYGMSDRQHRPKFFDQTRDSTSRQLWRHKEDDKILELQSKYKCVTRRQQIKGNSRMQLKKKDSDRFEALAPWVIEDVSS